MSKLKSLVISLKKNGLITTCQITASYFLDQYFDIKYKTDTSTWVDVADLDVADHQKKHAEMYQHTHAAPLRKLFKRLNFSVGKVFVDFGSGKGRVLLVASDFGFKELRGIEFSKDICKVAGRNVKLYQDQTQSHVNIVIINADVRDYHFKDDEDVCFLFNPFDEHVLKQVVHNLSESLQRKPRKLCMIYRNALYKDVIKNNLNVTKINHETICGQDFVVFEIEPKISYLKNNGVPN